MNPIEKFQMQKEIQSTVEAKTILIHNVFNHKDIGELSNEFPLDNTSFLQGYVDASKKLMRHVLNPAEYEIFIEQLLSITLPNGRI